MNTSNNIHSFSRKFLGLLGFFYVLNFVMEGKLESLFALVPTLITDKLEFWRIFTFALAPGSVEAVIITAFAFFFVAPRLEEILNNALFPLFIFLLVSLQGILHTLVFWKSSVVLSGAEGLSFFIIVLYSIINPWQRVKLWHFPSVRIIWLSGINLVFWMSMKFLHYLVHGEVVLVSAASTAIYGHIIGLLTYFQYRIISRLFTRRRQLPDSDGPTTEELKYAAIISSRKENATTGAPDEEYYYFEANDEHNEEKLNEILDKILEKGENALSPDEKRFLDDYSKNMK